MTIHDQRSAALAAAQLIIDNAPGRDLTGSEQASFDGRIAEVKAIDERLAKPPSDSLKRLNELGRVGPNEVQHYSGRHGKVFAPEDEKGMVRAFKSRTAYRAEIDRKSLTGAPVPPGGSLVSPGIYPGVPTALANLFPTEQAVAGTVRYYQLGGAGAAVVAEGALKPDAGVTVTAVDLALTKIATTQKISDEFSEDAAFLVNYLQGELVNAIVTAENTSILTTMTGTSGIATATGTAAAAIDVFADAVASQESLNGETPAAIVVTPQTLATIRKGKASTAGSYFLDPVSPGPSSLHGVPLLATPNLAAGTAWVIQSGAVVLFRRGPVSMDIGFDTDDFRRNMRTLRCEERLGTAVVRPGKLCKVTLT